VYRFTKENYPAYKQIVVFGHRRSIRPEPDVFKSTCEWLQYLDDLPELDVEDGVTFVVPPSQKDVVTFKSATPGKEEISNAVILSTLWKKALGILPKVITIGDMKPPVLPLKPAHIAVDIAAGAVGGVMGDHILCGRSEKLVDTVTVPDEKGETETKTERVVTTVRIFDRGGVHNLEGGAKE
jgi:hypothetical protein